ncbi:phosphate ABC transporter substrate-binding protein [Vibrio sp. MACH09]|uniref:phosphate ABC transporter substrate-binding protein n=1 Tax=unclassified Vibrio TaxID=2614977 RepID=UPI0014933F27|nr:MULTISPECIES: phosphate ABC transporter substrate-binding protein [unclassified Vibrio]NOI67500.1 phosphate ABC transporter substrate-binding protein [Vibrio sp. 99-8-1]GLO63822.1 phosphate ABC transporter substrate-binding protein [Vibrio sp. MACH09]
MFRVVLATLLSLVSVTFGVMAKEVTVSGSTSVSRIMDVLAEEFNATSDSAYIAVQGIGSTAGITMVKKGVSEIGMSSRYLTEAEYNEGLTALTIAYDGLAVVTNHSNPIDDVSRQQLYNIYKGSINNWKQLGGADLEIAVVTREQSSGSRSSFESLLGLTRIINNRLVSDINATNLVVSSNSMVKALVNHNPQAIGFVSEGSVDNSVKELKFEGVKATMDNIAAKKYQLSRPFILLYKNDGLTDSGKAFIEFIKSPRAKELIQQYGYVPTL